MTVEEELEQFANALRDQLEGALLVSDSPNQLLDAMKTVEHLLTTSWPPLAESISRDGLRAEHRTVLEKIVTLLSSLEDKTRGRLVWLGDFEDYMRKALETRS